MGAGMNAAIASEDSDVEWRVEEELPEGPEAAASKAPWRVLIVDDDVDVHVVTKFALSNASFMGRRLSFLHAYSGAEAMAILRETPDIALILLDVIMETHEAGLRVARQIREELGNQLVRIVLRTGQPGQSLEHSIIVDYDINDFWCKTDLTTRKLFTTVIASLRAYAGMEAAQRRIESLLASLEQARGLAAADCYTLVLTFDDVGAITDANASLCTLLACRRVDLLGSPLARLTGATGPSLPASASWTGNLTLTASNGVNHTVTALLVPLAGGPQCVMLMKPLSATVDRDTG
jgi:CheY-like chemotaxis protein